MNLVGEQGQKLRTRQGITGSQLIVSWVSATRLHSRGWCYSQATFEEAKEERVFGQRAVWSKGHGNHTGQDKTRGIICFFTISVVWPFYFWEQAHGDCQRHWWCPWHLMLLVITSLWTCPWIQSIFSLMIAPGSPFLGRLTWIIAANSQVKHRMRSWWLTCRLSSKDRRKIGIGMVAIH